MTSVSIMRTKAEDAIIGAFADVADRLPGTAGIAAARSAAIEVFKENGLPHRRIEEWKYTDLRSALPEISPPMIPSQAVTSLDRAAVDAAISSLAGVDAQRIVFADGAYRPDLSDAKLDEGVQVRSLAQLLSDGREAEPLSIADDGGSIAALNTAFVTDGAVIDVADGADIARPIFIIELRVGAEDSLTSTRHVLRVGNRARATFVQVFARSKGAATGQTNTFTQTVIGDGAEVSHVNVCIEHDVTHLSTSQVSVGGDASYRGFQYTSAVALARHQVIAQFTGENAKLDLSGAFLARGKQHVDNTLVVNHELPGCESRELFKGVLDDDARGVFQGKVIVQPEAQKTDGKQMAQALLLSESCEFDSKPELEIYADDVICGHGSTCAEIDPEMVFYCRSRGIPEETAHALLIEAFISEAIEQVEQESVAAALGEMASAWLDTNRN